MKNSILKGSLLISLAACCYGMLGTFVKMAYLDGFNTAEVTVSQFTIGFISLLFISCYKRKPVSDLGQKEYSGKSYIKMIAGGASLGLTSIFYYLAVRYISVSIGIILLVQAVWMSIVLEAFLSKKRPDGKKIVAVLIILIGTVFATDVMFQHDQLNWKGIAWGILAASSYTVTMYSSNNIGLQFPPLKRSFLMVTGGFIVVLLVFIPVLLNGFSLNIFLKWGLMVSLFGTVLPPILFTKGMPLTGMSLGAICTSLEIPVAILFAHFLLGEVVSPIQWAGVILILSAVVLINLKKKTENGI